MQNSPKISYWELKTYFTDLDYLIIGAGIVGYSTALHLRRKFPEAKILLVEQGFLPSGASSKNAGFACFGSASELAADLRSTPADLVWQTVEWRWKGLKALRSLIGDTNLDYQMHGSWDLITANEEQIFDATLEQLEDFNRNLFEITGEKSVYSVDGNVGQRFGFKGVETSFFNRLEGQIDTAGMNQRFYQLAIQANIHLLFGMEVTEIHEEQTGMYIETKHGAVKARKVFVCTNGFASRFLPDAQIAPARAQVLITTPIPNLELKGTFHYQEGYYYFRNIDQRILFGGGRNLDFTGETSTEIITTERIMKELERLLREVIAPDYTFEIAHQWAGIMGVGPSKQPIIRQISDNLYCGVRMGGMGVAIGTLVGQQLAECIKS